MRERKKAMAAKNKLSFDIEANSDQAKRALAELRREFDATLGALKKQQGDIALFKAAQQDAAKLEAQIKRLAKAGGDTSAMTATLNAQRSALAQQAAALQAAGVDTNALAAAQSKLRSQVDQVTRGFVQESNAVSAAAAAAKAAADASAAADQRMLAGSRARLSALEAERQSRIAYGNQVLASLRAEAAAQAAASAAAAARAKTGRGEWAVAQTRALAQAQAQSFAAAQKSAAGNRANAAAMRDSGSAAAGARAQIAGYATALLSVGAAMKGIHAITSAGMQLQALNSTLLFATGSAEEAASAYAFVREEAERLGLPLQVLGKQFGQMSAAANGTALAGEATRKIFSSVASAARVMGLQTFQVERALLAIQQMMSKGNVQAEELRGQLGEQIPGAMGIAARAMGVTTKELGDMMKAGELLTADFLPKFAAELQRTVDPAVPAAVRTYAAEVERLKNTFTLFLQEVGKSGALEAISAQVVIVTQKLQEMSDAGELKTAIDQVVQALSLLATGLAELAEFVAKNADVIIRLAEAFAIFKAAQIGLGLAKTVAEFGAMDKAALAAATSVGKVGFALKGIAAVAVLGFTVNKLVELVEVIQEANRVEEEMATDRGRRNAEADILIIQNADYARAVKKTAAEVKAASDKERAAYAASMKAALAYWDAVQQRALRNVGPTDAVPQAALDAARQARIYRIALAELDGISDERLKLEESQAAAIKRIKEGETATIKLALEAQIDAVKKARAALHDTEKEIAAIAKRTAAFQKEFEAASKPKDAPDDRNILDVSALINQAKAKVANGDYSGAMAAVEEARALAKELVESGRESALFLTALVREAGNVALAAGAGVQRDAEAKLQEEERKLLTLQNLAQQIESLTITANVDAAEKEMQALHARTQAFYAANPLIVKVVTQRQDDQALGIEKLPAKASGGAIRGPGTGTSDSILMYGSNGEFMLRAAAVKRLGMARLNYMNRTGRIPGFADGGAIGNAVGSLPRPGASGGASTVLNLTLPGVGTFQTHADAAVADSLERALRSAALKHGRRT